MGDKYRYWKCGGVAGGYNAAALVLCVQGNEDATGLEDLLAYAEYLYTTGGSGSGSLDFLGSPGS